MVAPIKQTYTKETRYYLMGIAMILVVMFHVAQHQEWANPISKILFYVFGYGDTGVDMFFLLSAYGLCYSYNSNKLKKFYWNRFVRIIPAYPLALIIGYCEAGTPFMQACGDFVQQVTGIAILNGTLDILWYMEALVLLYASFPFFYWLCRKAYSLGIGSFLFFCILIHVLLIFVSDYWLQLMIRRIPVMVVGVFTFFYDKEDGKRNMKFMYGSLALMALMPMLSEMYFFVPAVLFLIAKSERRVFKNFLTFVGKHSFEIFIGHHFALWVFNYSQWNYYVTIFLAFILIVVFASIIYYMQRSFGRLMDYCLCSR